MHIENKTIKVLTIEDDRSVRESFIAYLEDYGYDIIAAENGKKGLGLFYSEKPDIVLVDLRMPEIDGLEVLKELSKKRPEVPLLVISGTGIIADVIEALHSGAWDYIQKPVEDMSIVKYSIEKALEKARMQIENQEYRREVEKFKGIELKNNLNTCDYSIEDVEKAREKISNVLEILENIDCNDEELKTKLKEVKSEMISASGLVDNHLDKIKIIK